MSPREMELNYRKMAVQNASSARLVVILYDILVSDMNGAIEAMRTNEVDKRAGHIKHALLVLQQLQGSLNMEQGKETAKDLALIYSHLRSKIMEAHFQQSEEILQEQMALVFELRGAWEKVDLSVTGAAQNPTPSYGESADRVSGSWSA